VSPAQALGGFFLSFAYMVLALLIVEQLRDGEMTPWRWFPLPFRPILFYAPLLGCMFALWRKNYWSGLAVGLLTGIAFQMIFFIEFAVFGVKLEG